MRPRLALAGLLALLASVAALLAPAAHASAYTPTSYGERLVELINQARADNGVAPLRLGSGTNEVAEAWTEHLVAVQTLVHNQHLQHDLETHGSPDVMSYGENVGYASNDDPDQLFDAYMNSPEHRDNILSSYFHYLGIGVVYDGDRAWNTMDFADSYGRVARAARPAPVPTHQAAPRPTATPRALPKAVPSAAPAPSHVSRPAARKHAVRALHKRTRPAAVRTQSTVTPTTAPVTAPPVVTADARVESVRALAESDTLGRSSVPAQVVIGFAAALVGFVAVRWVAAVR